MSRGTWERACYRRLLRVYPPAFRHAYGGELEDTFGEQRLEPRYQGRFGALVFWIDVFADLARSAARLRLSRTRERRQRSLVDIMLHDVRYSLRLLARQPG